MNNILKSIAILTVALPTFTSCDNYLTELNPNETTTEVFGILCRILNPEYMLHMQYYETIMS